MPSRRRQKPLAVAPTRLAATLDDMTSAVFISFVWTISGSENQPWNKIMSLTIYHNPRFSKSRQTLGLIEEAGITPHIVKYLETPLSENNVRELLEKLGFETARQLMRKGEAAYKELGLKNVSDEDALISAMVDHPKLIERPIVDNGTRAVLGRPPENVTALF